MAIAAFLNSANALERTEGLVTVHYESTDADLATLTLSIFSDGLNEYGGRLPAGTQLISVHLCATRDAFEKLGGPQDALRVSGFARSREGIVVLKTPRLLPPGSSFPGIARHELLHVLLARQTARGHLPRWLNEGIAMTLSRELRWLSLFHVARMYWFDRIIPYDQLPFVFAAPGNEVEFGDAYAQSLSMTTFLREKVGEESFWEIVYALDEKSFADALRETTGLSPEEFYDDWTNSLWQLALMSSLISGVGVFQIGAVLLVLAFLRKRHRAKAVVRGWEEEEDEDIILFPSDLEGREPPYSWEEKDE